MAKDRTGDLRMLGERDGYAWSLVMVRNEIKRLVAREPDPRHVRKVAAHKKQLAPLLALERQILSRYDSAVAGYKKSKRKERAST